MANIEAVLQQGASLEEPVQFNGFPLGINNLRPDYDLDPKSLRDSSNIDFYTGGKTRLRSGYSVKNSLVGAHSLWSDPKSLDPDVAYYVAGTTMYSLRFISGSLVSSAVVTGLTQGKKVAYQYLNGDTFWTNGVANGRIKNSINCDWGIETPANKPVLTAGAVGGLFPGRYQVALTYRSTAGEESGTDVAASVDVPLGGSIVLTGMAPGLASEVSQTCVYCTAANGEVLHRVAVLPDTASTHTINTVENATTVLKTQFLQAMMPGDRLAHLNGSLYVATGNTVFFTEPMRFGLCNLNENFYLFPQEVTEILAVPDGLYVCSDKTYFLVAPGTQEVKQTVVLPFGAVRGTGTYLPNSMDVAWFSPRGQIIGSLGGQVKAITESMYMPGTMTTGTALVREKQGLKQIINTVYQTEISTVEYATG